MRLEIWVEAKCGRPEFQTEGFAISLEGVPWNHSPEGCRLKQGLHGGEVKYGNAARFAVPAMTNAY